MIVAGLPILPAELAVVPPALLPDSAQACETSAGSMAEPAGDVPAAWLRALEAALVRATGLAPEPLEGKPGPARSDQEESDQEEEDTEAGGDAPAATEAFPAAVAARLFGGWERGFDQVAPSLESGGTQSAERASALAGPRLAAEGAAGRDRPAETAPAAPGEPIKPSPAPPVEALPERPVQSGEVAFHARISQRPIAPAATVAAVIAGFDEKFAQTAPRPESPPAAGAEPAGNPKEAGGDNRAAARPERIPLAEPVPAGAPRLEPARHSAEPRPPDRAPAAVTAQPVERAAPRAQAPAEGEREPAGQAKAGRTQLAAPLLAELASAAAPAPASGKHDVRSEAPAAEVRLPAGFEPAPVREPARRIDLRLGETSEPGVSLQVVDRSGRVEVAVRAADPDLAGSLREALPALVRRLEHAGFRAETWAPEAAPARLIETREAPRAAMDLADPREGGRQSGGGEPDGERGQAQERRSQFEPGDTSGEEGKENERWGAWLWR